MRYWKRTTNNNSWSTEAMRNAIEAVKNKSMSIRETAQNFDVPRGTLWRHAKDMNKELARNGNQVSCVRSLGHSNDKIRNYAIHCLLKHATAISLSY